MRFKRTLAAITLAGAMSSSSCFNMRYVGMDAYRQYNAFYNEVNGRLRRENAIFKKYFSLDPKAKEGPLHRYSCEGGMVMPGGLKTHSYVFLQTHNDTFTGESDEKVSQSQVTIFRVLSHLAKMGKVDIVIYEGFPISIASDMNSKEYNEHKTASQSFFKLCIDMLAGRIRELKRDMPAQKELEDICLMNFYASNAENAYYAPIFLFYSDHPEIKIAGFEKETTANSKLNDKIDEIGKKKTRKDAGKPVVFFNFRGVKEYLESLIKMKSEGDTRGIVAGSIFTAIPNMDEATYANLIMLFRSSKTFSETDFEWFDMWHKQGRYILEERSAHAVESMLAHSSRNTAVLIGARHFVSVVTTIGNVPHMRRPTVHFLEEECTNRQSFVTPAERMHAILDKLGEKQKGNAGKQ